MSLTEPAATASSVPVPSSAPTHRSTTPPERLHSDVSRPTAIVGPPAFGQRSDSAPRHGGSSPAAQGDAMITVHVPAMTARHDVRTISAVISDVPGVHTLRADLATGTVQVTGSADPAAITAAVTAAGYPAVDYTLTPAGDDSTPTHTTRTRGRPVDTFFSTDITDLPAATRSQAVELGDGD